MKLNHKHARIANILGGLAFAASLPLSVIGIWLIPSSGWAALVASAVAVGVRMNFDLGPEETGATLVDRVLAVKAAMNERDQRARDKAAVYPE